MGNKKAEPELKWDKLELVTGGTEYMPTEPTDDELPGNNDNELYPENPQQRPFS